MKKNPMSLEECVKKAKTSTDKKGYCILAFDLIQSTRIRHKKGSEEYWRSFVEMTENLNRTFQEYLCSPTINSPGERDRFDIYRGDTFSACVKSAEGVRRIIEYQEKNYPNLPARFVVGNDCFDPILKEI